MADLKAVTDKATSFSNERLGTTGVKLAVTDAATSFSNLRPS